MEAAVRVAVETTTSMIYAVDMCICVCVYVDMCVYVECFGVCLFVVIVDLIDMCVDLHVVFVVDSLC